MINGATLSVYGGLSLSAVHEIDVAGVPGGQGATLLIGGGSQFLHSLIEAGQFYGAWSFCLRLEDEAGQKLHLSDDGVLQPLAAPR